MDTNGGEIECTLTGDRVLNNQHHRELGVADKNNRCLRDRKFNRVSFIKSEILALVLFGLLLVLSGLLISSVLVASLDINSYLAEYYIYIDNTSSLRTANANLVQIAVYNFD